MAKFSSTRPNTLGLRKKELNEVIDALESGSGGDASPRRKYTRRPFRQQTVPVRLTSNSGSQNVLVVACRDLSRGGMAFLHSAYVHVGTRVYAALPHPYGNHIGVLGTVVRCTHRSGLVHDVGVQFDEEINARELLCLDPMSDCFSLEAVDAEQLTGRMLHVEDSTPDQRLVKHYLRPTSITIVTVGNGDDALKALESDPFDLILTDWQLPGMDGTELIAKVRDKGISTPVIVTTAEDPERARLTFAEVSPDAFLAKPIDQGTLFRALAEFLALDGGIIQGSMQTTLQPNDPNAGLIPEFIKNLHEYAEALAKPAAELDEREARAVLGSIKGGAAPMGFEAIGQLAALALDAIDAGGAIKNAQKEIASLIGACKQARG